MAANLYFMKGVVILMMGNRSFDHMLGYLSLPKYAGHYPSVKDVNGLRDDQDRLNSLICDRWFSCIPAGTQPNRLMAMSGYSQIDTNQDVLPNQLLAYD